MATLFLIPNTLGECRLDNVMPAGNADVIRSVKHFIVEDVRTARRFLKLVDRSIDIDSLTFYELNQHTDANSVASYLEPMEGGFDMGVISEAGCPAVADPGADVVAIAQKRGYKVVPLVGPSSILLSVMASGFNGQSFAFLGYLPIDTAERQKAVKKMESRIYSENQTQIFIETPYRNAKLVEQLLSWCQPSTKLCIAYGITTPNESIHTHTIAEWRKCVPQLEKVPCIFLLYK
ncbi:MAG: SAM-dependent methyltransferase [Paludibacteraceae bacterium]|nr:SAM-dependent methyltransferase [Paludibacteraceae bacterium]